MGSNGIGRDGMGSNGMGSDGIGRDGMGNGMGTDIENGHENGNGN